MKQKADHDISSVLDVSFPFPAETSLLLPASPFRPGIMCPALVVIGFYRVSTANIMFSNQGYLKVGLKLALEVRL